jgi:hypothetical protein
MIEAREIFSMLRTTQIKLAPIWIWIVIALNGLPIAPLSLAIGQETANSMTLSFSADKLATPIARDPIWVYNDWSAYDELSDRIPLTEELALRELTEVARLQGLGVHFDYYMMDAFWFAPDGGYRKWRTPNWPNGPDRWIAECHRQGIMPGMWFGSNALVKIDPAPKWRDSLNEKQTAMSFYEGGFLPDLMESLQYWYDHGIRMFEFDFADFSAATPEATKNQAPSEIRAHNESAFREALKNFRAKNPDIVLEAFNGFGGDVDSTVGPFPFRNPIDLRWLEAFDALYAGDPRPSDVPTINFWRSVDIYSDHMVRRFEQSYLPLERIDTTAFMIGNTGTNYYRKTAAWQGSLLLTAARGGWINTVHGNLEFLGDKNARWFAKLQSLFAPLQAAGRTKTFGGLPGNVEPYGYASINSQGTVYTVVNPAQQIRDIELPVISRLQPPYDNGRILFRDAGFDPVLKDRTITVGPEQLAVVGYGGYANPNWDLGVQEDVRIPSTIRQLQVKFEPRGQNVIETTVSVPAQGDLRIVVQQYGQDGDIERSWPGGPPNGTTVDRVLTLHAIADGKELPVAISYDKMIWSGLSWAAGEIRHDDLGSREAVIIRCSSAEKNAMVLDGRVYCVDYK